MDVYLKKPKMDTMEVKLQLNQPHVANSTVEPRGLVRYLASSPT
jgi:hypothetical protein